MLHGSDLFYLVKSVESLNEIFEPGLRQAHEVDKKDWLATDEFSTQFI